jgi:hypothetical protein
VTGRYSDKAKGIEEDAVRCIVEMRSRVQLFPLLLTTEAPVSLDDLRWHDLRSAGDYHLKQWLVAQGSRTDGPDELLEPKTQCSYLVGRLAMRLSSVLSSLALDGRVMINPEQLDDLCLRPWREPWSHVDPSGVRESGVVLHIDPLVTPQIMMDTAQLDEFSRIDLCRRVLNIFFEPIIARLRAITGLSEQAQWRLVADMAAGAFLKTAKDLGDAAKGMALGRLLVRGERSKLTNKQVDYINVTLLDAPPEEDWFLNRGGCCRWYTTQDPVDYCATCVLLKPEEKQTKLVDYMRERRVERQTPETGA